MKIFFLRFNKIYLTKRVLLILLLFSIAAAEQSKTLVKPTSVKDLKFSGDGKHVNRNSAYANLIKAQVIDEDSTAVKGYEVHFNVISYPQGAKPPCLYNQIVLTDSNGIAQTGLQTGNQAGVYVFSAKMLDSTGDNVLYYRLYTRHENWSILAFAGFIGGLALFLFGLNTLSNGLRTVAGDHLREILGKLTHNRITAVFSGISITTILQSSSVTTVLLISLVQANVMNFGQSLGVILGADIGTTITAQLIAFKLTNYALIIVAAGAFLRIFSGTKKFKYAGESILGFGLLFYGMHIMSESMEPLRFYTPIMNLLLTLENPLAGLLVGTLLTALMQSSSAFIGIIIVLAMQGLITLDAGIPLLFGANLGTCVTAFLATLNTGREAKQVATAHILFKIFGVLLFVWWIEPFAQFIRMISPTGNAIPEVSGDGGNFIPRQIANAHTIFNVVLTIIALPFMSYFAAFIQKILPAPKTPAGEKVFRLRYLDKSLLKMPELALNVAKEELLRMARKVKEMVAQVIVPFTENDHQILEQLPEKEDEIKFLRKSITDYLTQISQMNVNRNQMDEVFQMLYACTELEQITGMVTKNLVPLAQTRINQKIQFSAKGREEILSYHKSTIKQLERAMEVFREVNLQKARVMEDKYQKYRRLEMELRRGHFVRLQQAVPETVASSEIHIELIELLKRISSHATNIARVLFEEKGRSLRKQTDRAK
ncbi:MAG: hypothetical protein GF313_09475 [Caldithrix sp.]|nr:hypothetical protein [Caldithrix sp.]